MPWVRSGDSSATHPIVLRGASVRGADERTANELYGFVHRLSCLSAQHLTDHVVEVGTVQLIGGVATDRLLGQAIEAGYLEEIELDGRRAWRIVDDPEFIHFRTREEVEWDRQRKRDTSNAEVTLEVLRRDGSACRYCGRSVEWRDRRGTRGGTYDHRRPGEATRSAEDLVVACRGCNSARGQAQGAGELAAWDAANPLMPPPRRPYYCDHARARLERAGIEIPAGNAPDSKRSGGRPGNAAATVERSAEARPRPAGRENARTGPAAGSVDRQGPEAGFSGTGRVGSGRSGQGRDGPGRAGSVGSGAAPPRRRRRRGRRGRSQGGGSTR